MKKKLSKKQLDYIVYTVLCVVFIGIMILIYKANISEEETTDKAGLNTSLPDPTNADLEEDKQILYFEQSLVDAEKNSMLLRQEQALYDLGAVSKAREGGATSGKNILDSETQQKLREIEKLASKPPIDFIQTQQYQSGNDNGQSQQMQSTIDELTQQIQDIKQQKTDKRQEDLMNMIASAANPNHGKEVEVSDVNSDKGKSRATVTPVKEVKTYNVTSMRRNSFRGIDAQADQKNTIKARIYGKQVLISGQNIRLRLDEDMLINNQLIKRGTIIIGTARLSSIDRLQIEITSIEYEDILTHIDIKVYDSDGQQGLYLPNSLEMDAARQIGIEVAQSVGSSASNTNVMYQTTPNAMEQVKADVTKGLIQGGFNYIGKKLSEIKVTVQDNHRVLLLAE